MGAGRQNRGSAELPAVPEGFPHPVVLGVDPGTRVVGYGALVLAPSGLRFLAAGVLRTGASDCIAGRLATIRAEFDALLGRLRPSIVAVEQAFSARNVRSALRIGEGRGVLLASAAATGAHVVEIAPAAAKKAVVGSGQADKTQVARMVEAHLGLDGSLRLPLDATDALALALAAVHRRLDAARVARPPLSAVRAPNGDSQEDGDPR